MIYNMESMMKQSGGPVTISSVLINTNELKPETVDAIRNAATIGAVNKAVELWGPKQALTVRDLSGLDMGYAAHNFVNTSNAAAAAWNIINTGAFAVPLGTVIAIYGVKMGAILTVALPELPVTAFRIDVGGSRHAQWQIQTLDQTSVAATVAATSFLGGVTRSPIIVAETLVVTISEWTRNAGDVYTPIWLGVAVEKEGVTLKP